MRNTATSVLLVAIGMGCGGDKSVEPRPQQDFPPRAVETFEAQTLTAERERLMIDFATAFNDPEERPLSYSAESSHPSVLTVAISGSVLTITPLAEGSATVSVKASDPGGNSATITISVTVNAPAHPDDDENYQPLSRLIVTANSVEFFGLSAQGSGSCIDVDPQTVYGSGYEAASYRFHHSRWQRQDEFGWITIPGTVRGENKLCVYAPPQSGLYRMVGDVTISRDGQTRLRFSSNVLNH
ncbi:MAG: hypothetical protein OXO51_07600 [Gemmatimonadota bacterium]|nr:hypothetical protein [Gemmatimonadota bacterium]